MTLIVPVEALSRTEGEPPLFPRPQLLVWTTDQVPLEAQNWKRYTSNYGTFLLHSLFLELRKLRFRDIKYFHKVELVEALRAWVIILTFYYNLTLNTWYENLFQPPVAEHQSKPGIFSFPISTTITVYAFLPFCRGGNYSSERLVTQEMNV